KAIEKRLIIPYFQPLMSMADGKLAAVEVLSRIDLGADGIMGAHEFIEIAESLGVIHQIDYIVMDKAFALAQQQAYEGMLFINLSPKSLLIGEFILQVKN
ncbi:EAL domain-containing protein, partial [Bacillus pacificus]|nr:EAL domain-containing protein [Bacillus pacificus]